MSYLRQRQAAGAFWVSDITHKEERKERKKETASYEWAKVFQYKRTLKQQEKSLYLHNGSDRPFDAFVLLKEEKAAKEEEEELFYFFLATSS